jgi:hypothetical protein
MASMFFLREPEEEPPAINRVYCPRCNWRHKVLKPDPNEAESPSSSSHEDAEYDCPTRFRILTALHSDIPELWLKILQTQTLQCAKRVFREDCPLKVAWYRFEISAVPSHRPKKLGDRSFRIGDRWYAPGEVAGPFFHNTKLENLVNPSLTAPESSGILHGDPHPMFNYGVCTHEGIAGVNFYVDGGLETFSAHPMYTYLNAWCSIEIFVSSATRLRGGRHGRYSVSSVNRLESGNNECYHAGISAILVPAFHLPDICLIG